MFVGTFLSSNARVMNLLVRAHVQFGRCFLDSYSLNPRISLNVLAPAHEHFMYRRETTSSSNSTGISKHNFENCIATESFCEHVKCKTLSLIEEVTLKYNVHTDTNGKEKRRKRLWGRWTYSSLLALSFFGIKSEKEETKAESELIIMIKRGIIALRVRNLVALLTLVFYICMLLLSNLELFCKRTRQHFEHRQ